MNKIDETTAKNNETGPQILVLIPAYNEAEQLPKVVASIRQSLPVLVVDDGSQDETAIQAQKAGATVIQHEVNQGKGAALQTGFRWAIERDYQAVITLDGDGQHDPLEIPNFLALYQETGADLIIGRRRFRQMPLIRRVSNWIGRWGFSWVAGEFIPDNQSGYRLISRQLMQALLTENHKTGFEFEVEMITLALQKRLALAWVPIQTIYQDETSHIQPVTHVLNFLRLLWQTRQRLQAKK